VGGEDSLPHKKLRVHCILWAKLVGLRYSGKMVSVIMSSAGSHTDSRGFPKRHRSHSLRITSYFQTYADQEDSLKVLR
jgi:hypothetical protein